MIRSKRWLVGRMQPRRTTRTADIRIDAGFLIVAAPDGTEQLHDQPPEMMSRL
jgi:hypothetical protein